MPTASPWRVLVVHKRSNLDAFMRKWANQTTRQKQAVRRVFGASHDQHHATLETVVKTLAAMGAKATVKLRDELKRFDEGRFDLVVTVGGDGTLLSVAPQIKKTPVLAVNSAPRTSVGFFAAGDNSNVAQWLSDIHARRVKPRALHRMKITVNGKPVGHPALNDVLFAHPSPVMTTRVAVKPPGARQAEEQKTSGVWVATPAGSSSVARAAGGALLPLDSKSIQYIVREPYVNVNGPYQFTKGIIEKGQSLTLVSRLPNVRVYIDGTAHEVACGFGDTVVFSVSPWPLLLYGESPVMRALDSSRVEG